MKLYDSIGPNPHVVRIFIAEKGIEIPREKVDVRGGENRREAYLARNPFGQIPALELSDGKAMTEITAICEYLEELYPSPSLIGTTPEERFETRMWTRRIDLNILEPMANGFRFAEGLKMFTPRVHCIPQAADDLKITAQKSLTLLDGLMGGKTWVCGTRFSLADIMLYAFLDFGSKVGQPLNPSNANITAWFGRVAARPSVAA